MFCPNCGNKTEFEQVFCRFCGLDVSAVFLNLPQSRATSKRFIKWLKRSGALLFGLLGGLMIALFSLAFIRGVLRFSEDAALTFFVMMSIFLTGITTALIFESRANSKKRKKKGSIFLTNPHPQNHLNESTFEPVPSVTEKSTDLLYVERLKPKISGGLN